VQRSGSRMSKLFRWSMASRHAELKLADSGRYFDFVSCFHLVTLSTGAISQASDLIASKPSFRSWFPRRPANESDAKLHSRVGREQEAT
jgi:hypothetical protein